MKHLITITIAALTLCCTSVCGQIGELKPPEPITESIYFTYDNSGNRISRSYGLTVVRDDNEDDDDELTTSSSELFEDGKTLENGSQEREIHVYPNPVRDELIVDILNGDEEKSYRFLMFDMSGKMVKESKQQGNGRFLVDMSAFINGTYILVINYEEGKREFKIIKE